MSTAANTSNDRYAIAYGSKYQARLDVAEIAKRLRLELKAAIKDGSLPKATYSVRIRRFAGGRSIDVCIDDVPFAIHNAERLKHDVLTPYDYLPDRLLPRYSPEAVDLLKKVKARVDAYNFDGSDIQTDYFHVNFYGNVNFNWDGQEKRERDDLVALYEAEKFASKK
jgi:hypothetical protein